MVHDRRDPLVEPALELRLAKSAQVFNLAYPGDTVSSMEKALKAGANGYLLREHTNAAQLENALQEVMKGGSPMTPDVARKVVEYFQGLGDAPGLDNLTHREREVLDGLAQGWLYKEIAHRLGISVETARKHLKNIYRKLEVSSRTEAVVKYLRSKS